MSKSKLGKEYGNLLLKSHRHLKIRAVPIQDKRNSILQPDTNITSSIGNTNEYGHPSPIVTNELSIGYWRKRTAPSR